MQLTPRGRRFIKISLIIISVLNALVSLWLFQRVVSLERRVSSLERNDKIIQSVEKLDTKVNSLKSRVEGLFR